MDIAIVTGAGGLVGNACCKMFSTEFDLIIGIDNNQRKVLFGPVGSVRSNIDNLTRSLQRFLWLDVDIRDKQDINNIFSKYGEDIKLVVHAAAQPSHDWSAKDPETDFSINTIGTFNILEAVREYCSNACLIHLSTNKVYGDRPNYLNFSELETRWEVHHNDQYFEGIDEGMSIDQCLHSPFGASKLSSDIVVQEYGKYFGLNTTILRAGCITGANHQAAVLHGFLAYLVKCIILKSDYVIYGYKGKQVRDNIHADDLANAIWHVYENPPAGGTVYNIGGGRYSNCSIIEAIKLTEEIVDTKFNPIYSETNRVGDHIWWITSLKKFRHDYPDWAPRYDTRKILTSLAQNIVPSLT